MSDDEIGGIYEDLPDIEKEKEIYVFGLDFEQTILASIFWLVIPLTIGRPFFNLGNIGITIGVTIIIISVIFGIWLIFGNGVKSLMNNISYYFSIQKGDLFSSELDYLLHVKNVENNIIHFNDGGMGMLLRVRPINFSIKNKNERYAIITSYKKVLNSLNFGLKIQVRTIKLNLDAYLTQLNNSFKNEVNPAMLSLQSNYIDYWSSYTKNRTIKNRLFYIFVGIENNNFPFSNVSENEEKLELRKKELVDKVERIRSRFKSMDIDIRILDKSEITNYFSNYFNSLEEKDEEFGFSLLLPQEKRFEE